jgi:Family of unknown function (DUF5677)
MRLPDEIRAQDIHEFAIFIADEYQKKSAKVNQGDEWGDIVRSALVSITHETVILHRALGDLCAMGWSSAATPIFRTMLDLMVSLLAIGHSPCPPIAAFRYFHVGYKRETRRTEKSRKWRADARTFLLARISTLPQELQSAAKDTLNEKDGAYWFQPEFKNPTEIIERFGNDQFQWLYRTFSAAAHGGFFGLRYFRDDPFGLSINPRLPLGRAGATLMLHSSRLLVEVIMTRDSYQRLGFKKDEGLMLSYFDKVILPEG